MKDEVIDYKTLYEKAQQELTQAQVQVQQKEDEITELNFELDKFRRYLFGSKSEKLSNLKKVDISQMHLFDLGVDQQKQEALSEQVDKEKPTEEKKTRKKRAKGTGRMTLPQELRREEIIIEPEEDTTGLVHIGDEITEVLDIVPAELYVKRYVRRKYARPKGEGILTSPLPERVIEKGIPSDRLIVEMTIEKYVYGQPLHRLLSKLRRLGVNIPASTASDWIIKGWKHLAPLWELLKLMVINQQYIQADESPIKVQEKQRKPGKQRMIHQGYMWVYHAPADNLVLFDYQKGRDSSGPKNMLKNFKGILQTDGYKVYESLYGNHPDIALVYCMAHARRKFVDAVKYDEKKANAILELISQLYKLEQDYRDEKLTWQQRTERRQKEATPVLNQIKKWLEEHVDQFPPSTPIGKAIKYTLPRWSGLSAYAQHGQIEIDNNLVENAIRPLAIGRKNFLFAGSHDAAEMTAAMYSFMATCKKNEVNEHEWMADAMLRCQNINHKDLYQLLPNNWKKYKSQTES